MTDNIPAVPDSLETMGRALALFTQLGGSGLLPKDVGSAADAAVIAGYSASLGRDPMWGLRNMHVVKGRAILSADAMLALALAHPDCVYIRPIETTDKRAVYAAARRSWGDGAEPFRFEFNEDDARRAGLWGSGNWAKYPKAMLRARCVSGLCRAVFPDAVAGVYEATSGELTDGRPADVGEYIDAEVVPSPPRQDRRPAPARRQPAPTPAPEPEPPREASAGPSLPPYGAKVPLALGAFADIVRSVGVDPQAFARFIVEAGGNDVAIDDEQTAFRRGGVAAMLHFAPLVDALNDGATPQQTATVFAQNRSTPEGDAWLDESCKSPPVAWAVIKATIKACMSGGES